MSSPPLDESLPATPAPQAPAPGHPSVLAREALHRLAALRLPPTPDNYARVYQELAAPGTRSMAGLVPMLLTLADELQTSPGDAMAPAGALRHALDKGDWDQLRDVLRRLCTRPGPVDDEAWAPLIRDLFRQWEARAAAITQARKREMLDHVLAAFGGTSETLHARLRSMVRAWSSAPPAARATDDAVSASSTPDRVPPTVASPSAAPAQDDVVRAAHVCRELLAQALVAGVSERIGYPADIVREAVELATDVRAANEPARVHEIAGRLARFWPALQHSGEDQRQIQQALLRLLHLLTANVSELLGDGSWMRGQLRAFAALSDGPVSLATLAALEQGLRDIAQRQGALRASLDQAKDAMKHMVATFIERVGTLAEDAGDYHDRLTAHAQRIAEADDLDELSTLIADVVDDTRGVQEGLRRSRDELVAARQTVEQFQERANRLETELVQLSDRLQEDQLTQVLNRRGLDRVYGTESARAERYQRPLSIAMLDVDNFKALNDRLGHQAGDSALVHLTRTIRQSLRTSDVIARYGGEEFVIVLPETAREDAIAVMSRVQRDLTRRFFLHHHERILITFSAGVAERVPQESQDEVIARADRALYQAKQQGKNRVVGA